MFGKLDRQFPACSCPLTALYTQVQQPTRVLANETSVIDLWVQHESLLARSAMQRALEQPYRHSLTNCMGR